MARFACAAIILIAMANATACKGKSSVSVKRTRTAPAVEYVPAPTASAAGKSFDPTGAATPAIGTVAMAGPRRPEVEPNNDAKNAQLVTLDSVVAGELSDLTDVDWYGLIIEKPMALNLLLASAGDVVLELRDSAGTVIAKSDRGGNGVTEGFPNVAVVKGRYIVTVTAFRKAAPVAKKKSKVTPKPDATPTRAGSATTASAAPVRYELQLASAVQAPRSGFEVEPNLDPGLANDLFIGEAANGYIGWTGDVDVWKLSIEGLAARTALDLELTAVDGVTPTLNVTDAAGRPLLQRHGEKSRPLAIRSLVPVIGPNVPPFYFVTVSGERSNPLTPYQLNVVARGLTTDDEMEPNDSNATAQPLLLGQLLLASWQIGDVDTFVIAPVATPRQLTFAITLTQATELIGEVVIANQPVIEFNDAGQRGGAAVEADVPAGIPCTVRVRGNLKRKAVEGAYQILVDVAHGAGDPMPNEQHTP